MCSPPRPSSTPPRTPSRTLKCRVLGATSRSSSLPKAPNGAARPRRRFRRPGIEDARCTAVAPGQRRSGRRFRAFERVGGPPGRWSAPLRRNLQRERQRPGGAGQRARWRAASTSSSCAALRRNGENPDVVAWSRGRCSARASARRRLRRRAARDLAAAPPPASESPDVTDEKYDDAHGSRCTGCSAHPAQLHARSPTASGKPPERPRSLQRARPHARERARRGFAAGRARQRAAHGAVRRRRRRQRPRRREGRAEPLAARADQSTTETRFEHQDVGPQGGHQER